MYRFSVRAADRGGRAVWRKWKQDLHGSSHFLLCSYSAKHFCAKYVQAKNQLHTFFIKFTLCTLSCKASLWIHVWMQVICIGECDDAYRVSLWGSVGGWSQWINYITPLRAMTSSILYYVPTSVQHIILTVQNDSATQPDNVWQTEAPMTGPPYTDAEV